MAADRKEIVPLLFTAPRVAIATIDYYLNNMQHAALNGLAAMTGALPISETNPTISDEDLFVWGAAVGSLNLVIYLLHKGVDPAFADNSAIVVANQNGHEEIVTYLSKFAHVQI